jgi:hypothetical protein
MEARASYLAVQRMRKQRNAIVYAYGRSVPPGSPLLQCLHTSAFEIGDLFRDIDVHSLGMVAFGFALSTLVFPLLCQARCLRGEGIRIIGGDPEA